MPTCLRLLAHLVRLAASRTFWTAGNKSAIRMPMIAMTTSNSMSVNAWRRFMVNSSMRPATPDTDSGRYSASGRTTKQTSNYGYLFSARAELGAQKTPRVYTKSGAGDQGSGIRASGGGVSPDETKSQKSAVMSNEIMLSQRELAGRRALNLGRESMVLGGSGWCAQNPDPRPLISSEIITPRRRGITGRCG